LEIVVTNVAPSPAPTRELQDDQVGLSGQSTQAPAPGANAAAPAGTMNYAAGRNFVSPDGGGGSIRDQRDPSNGGDDMGVAGATAFGCNPKSKPKSLFGAPKLTAPYAGLFADFKRRQPYPDVEEEHLRAIYGEILSRINQQLLNGKRMAEVMADSPGGRIKRIIELRIEAMKLAQYNKAIVGKHALAPGTRLKVLFNKIGPLETLVTEARAHLNAKNTDRIVDTAGQHGAKDRAQINTIESAHKMLPGAACNFSAGVFDSFSGLPWVGEALFARASKNMNALGKEFDDHYSVSSEFEADYRTMRTKSAQISGKVWGSVLQSAASGGAGAAKAAGDAADLAMAGMELAEVVSTVKGAMEAGYGIFNVAQNVLDTGTKLMYSGLDGKTSEADIRKELAGAVDATIGTLINAAKGASVDAGSGAAYKARQTEKKEQEPKRKERWGKAALRDRGVSSAAQKLKELQANPQGTPDWKNKVRSAQNDFKGKYMAAYRKAESDWKASDAGQADSAKDGLLGGHGAMQRAVVSHLIDSIVALLEGARGALKEVIEKGYVENGATHVANSLGKLVDTQVTAALGAITNIALKPLLQKLLAKVKITGGAAGTAAFDIVWGPIKEQAIAPAEKYIKKRLLSTVRPSIVAIANDIVKQLAPAGRAGTPAKNKDGEIAPAG